MPELWILNHYAGFPETVPAVRTYELAKRLAARGWSVTVLASSFNHYSFSDDWPSERAAIHEQRRDGVRWLFVKGAPYAANGAARLRNMLDYVRHARRWMTGRPPPDVVVGTTVHPFAAELARRFAKTRNLPFVYEITDLWPETLVDLGSASRRSAIYRLFFALEARAFRDADGVIGLLPLIPKYARDAHGRSVNRFCYVPNGVAARPLSRESQRVPGRVVYAGGFAAAHGMDVILNAAERLSGGSGEKIDFFLYGDGPERTRLENTVATHRLGNVHFEGLIAKRDLPQLLERASVGLCTGEPMPVHRYGISTNKLFDYFDARLPVVFAVDSGNNPVAEAGAGITTPAGDGLALAEAIKTLAELPEDEARRLGEAGRAFLAREHDFDVLATRLERFLLEMLPRSEGPYR